MLKKPVSHFVLSTCAALLASSALIACGGSSDESGSANMAQYAPADSLLFADATVRPDGQVASDMDEIATSLTGSTISEALTEQLADQEGIGDSKNMSYDADIEPWLGENIAMFGTVDLSSPSDLLPEGMTTAAYVSTPGQTYGVVAQSTDETAAQAFIDKAAEGEDVTDNEYEGSSYMIDQADNTALGIVDGNVVLASDEAEFQAIVDASSGDSLADTQGFEEVGDKVSDNAVMTMFVANQPILKASGEDQFPGIKDLYAALGIDVENSATAMSIVPSSNRMAIEVFTNTSSDIVSGDASALISSFPADSVVAAGSAGVGENISKVIDAIEETGIEGMIAPGELRKNLSDASEGGLDVEQIITSIQDVGFFVSGDTEENLGGALVVTTSDPEPLKDAVDTISSIIALSGDARVKPLGGGKSGVVVKTPELPGRPVVFAVEGDRLVVAIGLPAANQALSGDGEALADTSAFKEASSALGGDGMDFFANASLVASLLRGQGDPDSKQAADIFQKFDFMTAGHGENDNSFEFIMNLKD